MSTLALSSLQAADSKPDFRHPHEFQRDRSFDAPSALLSGALMTANPSHRGLPPPGAINLPDPTRSQAVPSAVQPLSTLPAPPTQWHGAEDSMRVWLSAKMEDDRRRQEELKLEQRRLEERMLREAYQSPVPPHLIPVIFAGLSGGPLASHSLDIAQQHLASIQHLSAYQPPHSSPDLRSDPRLAGPQPQYLPAHPSSSSQQQQQQQQQPPPPSLSHHSQQHPPPAPGPSSSQQAQAAPGQYSSPAYPSPQSRSKPLYGPTIQYAPHTASSRGPPQSSLPRLSTNEPSSAAQSSFQQQDQNSPSPNIYFHHWQPPAPNAKELKDAHKPPTNPPWRISSQDFTSSPRGKRKATGQHEARNPPPTSNPTVATSPTYSAASTGSGKSQRRPRSRESQQRRAYDVIERRNRHDEREGSSRDHSTSGRSEPVSRHETPKDGEGEAKAEG